MIRKGFFALAKLKNIQAADQLSHCIENEIYAVNTLKR